jgi:hypothetical protein
MGRVECLWSRFPLKARILTTKVPMDTLVRQTIKLDYFQLWLWSFQASVVHVLAVLCEKIAECC